MSVLEDLSISQRWHHAAHAHSPGCAHEAPKDGEQAGDPKDGGRRHVGKMSVELGAGQAIAGIIATGWLALAAHHLSVRHFGELTVILSLGSLVSSGTDLGIPLALTKLACDNDVLDRPAVHAAIRRRTVAGVGATLLLILLWANTGGATRWWLGALYGISVTVNPVTSSWLAILRGRAIGSVEAVYSIASKLALPVLGLAALGLKLGVGGIIVAYAMTDAFSAVIVSRVAGRRIQFTATPDPKERAQLTLRATLPLSAAGIVGSLYERIDVFVVAVLKGSAIVALYGAAYKLYDAVLMPARAMGASAVAAAGRDVGSEGRRAVARLAAKAVLITIPIAAAGAAFAPALVKKAFGHQYGSAGSAVVLLMAATIPGAALTVITPIALLCRRHAIMAWTGVGLFANVVGNVVLVPTLGVKGASLAFLITESVLLVACFSYLPKPSPPKIAPPGPVAAGQDG